MKTNNVILEKSFEFSVSAVATYKKMLAQKEFVISKQFLRSSTSIGANVHEAMAAYSRKEFASKLSIASKEARETMYWIMLLKRSNLVEIDTNQLENEINSIINILTSIVKTVQTDQNSKSKI
jgi:four helix bundle protein